MWSQREEGRERRADDVYAECMKAKSPKIRKELTSNPHNFILNSSGDLV